MEFWELVKEARREARRRGDIRELIARCKLKPIAKWHTHTAVWASKYAVIKNYGTKVGKKPKDAVRTICVNISGFKYLIQPRVKDGCDKAYEILAGRNPRWAKNDGCPDNCGWHYGEPVIIDW
jgi:hypothetical protein